MSFSSTSVVADLPQALVLGASYTLTLTNNQSFLKPKATLDLTLGLAGPQPPQSHAYSASCTTSCSPVNGLDTMSTLLSTPVPAGSYVINAKAELYNGDAGSGNACQIVVQSNSTILDVTHAQTGAYQNDVVIVNFAAAQLSVQDTLLFQCQGAPAGYAQLVATQVGGLN